MPFYGLCMIMPDSHGRKTATLRECPEVISEASPIYDKMTAGWEAGMETNTSLERAGRKAIIGRALLAALGLALLAAYILHIRKDMTDFEVSWQAGRRLLHGEALYRVSDGHLQFKYSPLAAMASVPFSILPLEAAKACWFVIQVLCLAGIGRLGIALLPARRKSAVFLLGFSFLILGKFLARELVLGQVNLLILLLFLAALASLLKGREAGFRR